MLAAQLQTPSLLSERSIDRLAAGFPEAARERLRANFRAFRSWVAEPAFRAKTPAQAVEHVLGCVGPAVQLKAELLAIVAAVPGGFEILVAAVTEELGSLVPEGGPADLASALDHLQRAQRIWFRFVTFHPDLAAVEELVGVDKIVAVLDEGFHADNLVAVCFMATDSESGKVKAPIVRALAAAAEEHAQRFHAAVSDLVEQVASAGATGRSFESSSLADLLALPPYDGPAATVEEMDEAIASIYRAP